MNALSLTRREAFLGAAALALAGPALASSGNAARRLTLVRGGSEIGEKTVSVRRSGSSVEVETRIDIAVRLIGLPVYRYELAASESWRGGELQALEARTNDNGARHFANAVRRGATLEVRGSEFEGEVGGRPATTSYWSTAFLRRPVWISTQDGRLLNVTATDTGRVAFPTGAGEVAASRWRIGGDLTDLYLFYDAADEWVGTEFPARGETARFFADGRAPALAPLWVEA